MKRTIEYLTNVTFSVIRLKYLIRITGLLKRLCVSPRGSKLEEWAITDNKSPKSRQFGRA